MTDFNATAEYVRRWAEQQRDIIALGGELKEIGSIDLARQEQQAALDKVNADLKTATDSLAAAKTEREAFLAGRDADLDAHKAAVAEITAAANRDAAEVKARAEVAAKEVIDAANAEVARIQAGHAETMAAVTAELQTKQADLDRATRDLEAARADHAALVEKIQQMKDLARTALGPT